MCWNSHTSIWTTWWFLPCVYPPCSLNSSFINRLQRRLLWKNERHLQKLAEWQRKCYLQSELSLHSVDRIRSVIGVW